MQLHALSEEDKERYGSAVLRVAEDANKELFEDVKEDKKMCEFIREFLADEIEEEVSKRITEAQEKAMREGRVKGRAEGRLEIIITQVKKKVASGRSIEEIAEALEQSVETIREIVAQLPT